MLPLPMLHSAVKLLLSSTSFYVHLIRLIQTLDFCEAKDISSVSAQSSTSLPQLQYKNNSAAINNWCGGKS